jgi:hypothetical protein
MLHPGGVERHSPAALVISGELEIVGLARHADRDPTDAGPGVEPGPQRPEGAVAYLPPISDPKTPSPEVK